MTWQVTSMDDRTWNKLAAHLPEGAVVDVPGIGSLQRVGTGWVKSATGEPQPFAETYVSVTLVAPLAIRDLSTITLSTIAVAPSGTMLVIGHTTRSLGAWIKPATGDWYRAPFSDSSWLHSGDNAQIERIVRERERNAGGPGYIDTQLIYPLNYGSPAEYEGVGGPVTISTGAPAREAAPRPSRFRRLAAAGAFVRVEQLATGVIRWVPAEAAGDEDRLAEAHYDADPLFTPECS